MWSIRSSHTRHATLPSTSASLMVRAHAAYTLLNECAQALRPTSGVGAGISRVRALLLALYVCTRHTYRGTISHYRRRVLHSGRLCTAASVREVAHCGESSVFYTDSIPPGLWLYTIDEKRSLLGGALTVRDAQPHCA